MRLLFFLGSAFIALSVVSCSGHKGPSPEEATATAASANAAWLQAVCGIWQQATTALMEVPGSRINPQSLSLPDRKARAAVLWPGQAAASEAALAALENVEPAASAAEYQGALESWTRSEVAGWRQAAAALDSIFSTPEGISATNTQLGAIEEKAFLDTLAASLTLPEELREQIQSQPQCSTLKFTIAARVDPTQYLEDAIKFVESTALYRGRVDWASVRAHATDLARGARTSADTYRAIRYVLGNLGDRHSALVEPQTAAQVAANPGTALPEAVLIGELGYFWLPPTRVVGVDAVNYAIAGQRAIKEVDVASPCGWIVDLRSNGGGSQWPMLGAVGPILGEGGGGAFTMPEGSTTPWAYRNGMIFLGASQIGSTQQAGVSGPGYQLVRLSPPVAVLTSGITASAAEAIVVSFSGRPLTRRFGTATFGEPTGRVSKTLADGAVMAFAESYMTDRTGRWYDDRIEPDEPIETAAPTDRSPQALAIDPAVIAASQWLKQQPGCRP